MKFSITLGLCIALFSLSSCETKQKTSPIVGTWELVSATSTEKDSTVSTFDPTHKMIKIINDTHFAFLNHALESSKDTSSTRFNAGGGTYTLVDSTYTESLEYFSDKAWENHKFEFKISMKGDTLIQKGIEKVEKLGIDHIIIEKYKRVK